MSCLLGLQALISSCTFHNWSQVHCYVHVPTWCHTCYEPNSGNEGTRLSSHLYSTLHLLIGLWGQLWRSWTGSTPQALSQNKTYWCLLPSLSWTRTQGTYQDIPYWHEGPDCWCTYQGLCSKWLYTSLQVHVWQMTSSSHLCEEVIRIYLHRYLKWPTYLWYLHDPKFQNPIYGTHLIPNFNFQGVQEGMPPNHTLIPEGIPPDPIKNSDIPHHHLLRNYYCFA